MNQPDRPAKPTWYRRKWVQIVAAGLLGLSVGGFGADSDAAEARTQLVSAEERAKTAEQRVADAQTAARTAKAAAEADLKAQFDKLAADREAFDAEQKTKAAALEERAKAVGAAEAEAAANTFPGDGVFIVGQDVQPGTYKSDGGENCYWERNTKNGDIIDNHLGSGPTVVVIKAGDFSITANRCAPFRKTT
jgi:hypothetical protein